ncbi:ATP-binding protein [Streptomyces sp. B3I8]|uniref:ATP-binding protein n=1 Tax=Streptomyces sp. B3I8 TaxID=3042303 RepID=UPI00278A84E1|nr:ATP-binding protein [Streptomyces sp. B3I8]MDQ0784958.1 signal transduction histidine kinase [Streptomyces sp. B3I8]MDQ0791502.1 signal transduction histidine kinase [Streptomyces sp. B3I8]
MPVPARPRPPRSEPGGRAPAAVVPAVLAGTAAGAAAVAVAAPDAARAWAAGTAAVAWLCVAALTVAFSVRLRRFSRLARSRSDELERTKKDWMRHGAETDQLAGTTLGSVVRQLKDGASAEQALAGVPAPGDPYLRRLLQVFAGEVGAAVREAAGARAELDGARRELERWDTELQHLTREILPAAVALLREGSSAETVLAQLARPSKTSLRAPAETFVRELAHSERRSAAAQAASAKALSRVQAKTVSMLADLREMQDRHGADVFGDLLRLDHSTSQLGLMTDRLALLMGGRSSRVWNKPIVMESILRGAVGRIAAYRRVRLHNSSRAALAGFAAEGVMHLLAELMDNAANFSPPIDEVHVYVEERSAGLVVTIEDSGLKMSDAAMRRAQESVSGQVTDLAALQGTRLGLGVVGRLAAKYGISVSYRPSSRGGTGVVVLLPPQLVAQQREPAAAGLPGSTAQVPAAAAPSASPAPAVSGSGEVPQEGQMFAPADVAPRGDRVPPPGVPARGRGTATPNGLPVRAPGHTMAAAERGRPQPGTGSAPPPSDAAGPARNAGSRFGAYHHGRRAGGSTPGAAPGRSGPQTGPGPDAVPDPGPGSGPGSGTDPGADA